MARMTELLNNLTTLMNLESSSTIGEHSAISMPDLIQQLVQDCQMSEPYQGQKITTNIDSELDIVGNSTELQSVISNLLSNALKYSPRQ